MPSFRRSGAASELSDCQHWKNPYVMHEEFNLPVSLLCLFKDSRTTHDPTVPYTLYGNSRQDPSLWRVLRTDNLSPELYVASSVCLAFPESYFKHHGQIIWAFNSCEMERIVKRFTWARVLMVSSVSLHIPMEKWDSWSQMLGWTASGIAWQSHGSCVLVMSIALREDIEFRSRFCFILFILEMKQDFLDARHTLLLNLSPRTLTGGF